MYGEEFPTPETQGRMSTSFGCSDFWDRLGGQAMLWLVDGIQGNHWPITSNASPPKWVQKSLRRKLAPIPLIVSVVENKWEIYADTRL